MNPRIHFTKKYPLLKFLPHIVRNLTCFWRVSQKEFPLLKKIELFFGKSCESVILTWCSVVVLLCCAAIRRHGVHAIILTATFLTYWPTPVFGRTHLISYAVKVKQPSVPLLMTKHEQGGEHSMHWMHRMVVTHNTPLGISYPTTIVYVKYLLFVYMNHV